MKYSVLCSSLPGRAIRVFLLSVLVALPVFLFGCTSDGDFRGISRSEVLGALDKGELGVSLALGFAQIRGADPAKIAEIRETAGVSFDLARNAVKIDLSKTDKVSLKTALDGIKLVVEDAFDLAECAGVDKEKLTVARDYAAQAFTMIEAVIVTLPEKTAHALATDDGVDVLLSDLVAAERPCTSRWPRMVNGTVVL